MPLYWLQMVRSRSLQGVMPTPRRTLLSGRLRAVASLSWARAGAKAASTASAIMVLVRKVWRILIGASPQRSLNCGVGLVVLGLFEPCTSVWQLRQPRPWVMLIGFLPVVVTVFGTTCRPRSCGWFGPCGVWH